MVEERVPDIIESPPQNVHKLGDSQNAEIDVPTLHLANEIKMINSVVCRSFVPTSRKCWEIVPDSHMFVDSAFLRLLGQSHRNSGNHIPLDMLFDSMVSCDVPCFRLVRESLQDSAVRVVIGG